MKNYYRLLGVLDDATPRAIKAAYRREALRWHPDRKGGSKRADASFKEVQEAFRVLSDPALRAAYNAVLHPDPAWHQRVEEKEDAYQAEKWGWEPDNSS